MPLTLSSNAAIPIPDAAPVPASPMKCPDPMLLANRDAPTCNNKHILPDSTLQFFELVLFDSCYLNLK